MLVTLVSYKDCLKTMRELDQVTVNGKAKAEILLLVVGCVSILFRLVVRLTLAALSLFGTYFYRDVWLDLVAR